MWEQKSLIRGVCLLFAGPDCSEVIGRENCGRICKQGSCVQASPFSFKCLCRSGGGRQRACVRLLVCPRKALLLSPHRNIQPRHLPGRANDLWKRSKPGTPKAIYLFKYQRFLTGFVPDPTRCCVCHRNAARGHSRSNPSRYGGQPVKSRGQTAG